MFDPKQITASMLGYAPQFVLARFSSVIMGVIAAYGVLLFFLGQPPFFQRVGELGVVMLGAYGAARGVRYAMVKLIAMIEGPDASAAGVAAPVAAAPPAASAGSSAATAKGAPSQQSPKAGSKEEKGLD